MCENAHCRQKVNEPGRSFIYILILDHTYITIIIIIFEMIFFFFWSFHSSFVYLWRNMMVLALAFGRAQSGRKIK